MPKSIVHLDADAFFASVEQASDSRLRGKPIAVGGEKRGIIASASYEARKFGVYTPMPTVRARKLCPTLIVLSGDYDRYEHFSQLMFSYPSEFTPDVEKTSIDEGYFDLSGTRKAPAEIALTIRKAIWQKLKISVSEGIGINKLVSQIASKLNKPAAFLEVQPGQETSFLHPLSNKWLPGIGPKASVRLNSAGLALVGQIAKRGMRFIWSAVAERSGDTAFDAQMMNWRSGILRAGESGVALRFPPQSKMDNGANAGAANLTAHSRLDDSRGEKVRAPRSWS